MKAAQLPVELEGGEILLQWYVPTWRARFGSTWKRALPYMGTGGFLSLLFLVFAGLGCGAVHPALGGVALLLGLSGLFVSGVLPFAFFFSRPLVRWWVTSRRLITVDRGEPRVFALEGLQDIDIRPPFEMTLTIDDQHERLYPVDRWEMLWGALLMGRALARVAFPAVLPDEPDVTVDGAICWNGVAQEGPAQTGGVLVFRPDRVGWVPSITTTREDRWGDLGRAAGGAVLGFKVRTIRPVPPLPALFYRLLRLEDPAAFDATLEAVTRAWGGFVRPGSEGLTVTEGRRGEEVSLEIEGATYQTSKIDHPDWPEVRASLCGDVSKREAG